MSADDKARALVSLLEDDDPRIIALVQEQLDRLGPAAIPPLEAAGEHPNPRLRSRARHALSTLTLEQVERILREFSVGPEDRFDLETALWALARLEDPGVPRLAVQRALGELAGEVRPLLAGARSPLEELKALKTVIHDRRRFTGVESNGRDLGAVSLHRVLERRAGGPLLLGAVHLLVAWRLRVPLVGVGLPNHFLVLRREGGREIFVDPFQGGAVLAGRRDLLAYLRDYIPSEEARAGDPGEITLRRYVRELGPREITTRVVRQMVLIYARLQDRIRERRLEGILEILTTRERTR